MTFIYLLILNYLALLYKPDLAIGVLSFSYIVRIYLLIFVFRISGCICMSENGHVVFRYCMSYAGLELY